MKTVWRRGVGLTEYSGQVYAPHEDHFSPPQRMKMEVKLDRELKETQAEESKEKKNKVVHTLPQFLDGFSQTICFKLLFCPVPQQTETIKLVFLTYFRILKHSRHSPLLQPVLEGLAKYVPYHYCWLG